MPPRWCHRMRAVPKWPARHRIERVRTPAAPLGSGQPDRSAARPGTGADRAAADDRVSAHVPDRGLAAGVLKKDVGAAAAGSDGVPARPGIGADRPAADQGVPFISQTETWPVLLFWKRMSSEKPSWVKSPVPIACQAGPGLMVEAPPPINLFPFISQIETWPVFVFCQRMSESPSLLKSPVPIACQAGPGLGVTGPPPIRLFPFISQIEAWPVLVFCHRMSEKPSSLKSPVPIACQAGPGLGFTGPPPIKVLPFISQIEAWPVFVFCHRMSEWPSSLKSPVPIARQLGPGLGLTGPPPTKVLPFISQIEAWPLLVFCHRMSAVGALTSSGPTAPGISFLGSLRVRPRVISLDLE